MTEDPPPQKRPRRVEEEDQPLKAPDTITIDRKILLMLVRTVKALKEGVKRGQETRASSSVLTKSSTHSEDEDMQEDEDLSCEEEGVQRQGTPFFVVATILLPRPPPPHTHHHTHHHHLGGATRARCLWFNHRCFRHRHRRYFHRRRPTNVGDWLMRALVRCACCPGGAARAPKKAPPAEGGAKEDALASHDMEALAAKCVWKGDYTN